MVPCCAGCVERGRLKRDLDGRNALIAFVTALVVLVAVALLLPVESWIGRGVGGAVAALLAFNLALATATRFSAKTLADLQHPSPRPLAQTKEVRALLAEGWTLLAKK
jgi:nitrogen fixation protein FixH